MSGPSFEPPAGIGATTPPPAVLLPDQALLFEHRAQRLTAWTDGHPMADFLGFLVNLAVSQHKAAGALPPPVLPPQDLLNQRVAGSMPVLPRETAALDGRWRQALTHILAEFATGDLPAPARQAVETLAAEEATSLDARAARFLIGELSADDLAASVFVAAALQVQWTAQAAALPAGLLRSLTPPGLCPVCGLPPVASVIMAGDPLEGVRYLGCGLCGTRWHFPRARCSSCDTDKKVAYLAFEGQQAHARAETCGECRTYLKVFDEAKSPGVEFLADDLATVGLDLRLAEEKWHRAAANPFLMAASR